MVDEVADRVDGVADMVGEAMGMGYTDHIYALGNILDNILAVAAPDQNYYHHLYSRYK